MPKYKHGDRVPTEVLAARLDVLSDAVANRQMNNFYMSIPARLDHDADLVLSEAGRRLLELESEIKKLKEQNEN